jgi:hypothetical protein
LVAQCGLRGCASSSLAGTEWANDRRPRLGRADLRER